MLVSPKILLGDAQCQGYAVGAFNFYNLDTLMSIIQGAEEENAPVIIQIYSTHFMHYNGGATIAASALKIAQNAKIPVALHLDHSSEYEYVLRAMRFGFNSVMFDGSAMPIEKNIEITKKVTEIARYLDIYTEAELGRILRAGSQKKKKKTEYTNVKEAERFVRETQVDSLAPAIGTAHGIYKNTPHIEFELLKEISDAVKIPLVLHGGSGIPEEMIVRSIGCGVRKINVGTDLKHTWSNTLRQLLDQGEKEPIALSVAACKNVMDEVTHRLRLFGSSGKAGNIMMSLTKENISV